MKKRGFTIIMHAFFLRPFSILAKEPPLEINLATSNDIIKVVGTNGETGVRFHIDSQGNIHGYPVFPSEYLPWL